MRYLKFRIANFKGIKDTEVDLRSATGANVFAFVGLNESGKTTILEAIHSFSPDHRTSSLTGKKDRESEDAAKERLPRHLIAHFTGEIIVEATVSVSDADKNDIISMLKSDDGLTADKKDIPDVFTLTRADIFERGDYVRTDKRFNFPLKAKKKAGRIPKDLSKSDLGKVYDTLWYHTPDIAYHDSFIFDFPKRIYVTRRAGVKDWVYRQMFEDVLAAGRVSYSLNDLTRRIRNEKYEKSWLEFFSSWSQNDDKDRIQQIIDESSRTITEAVFGKWNKIFKEDTGNKEILVRHGVEEGRQYVVESKSYEESEKHDLYISLEIKDGVRRFPVQDRSLGFRWFFAFLLFTQFRTKRSKGRPVLFLFDEPAANLHSAAQERLIESFPEIATADNMLLYSTHSHYMISPDWLEQTFIVANAADAPSSGVVDGAVVSDEFLDIRAERYRSFANRHPTDTSYFQPIIDRLEVQPSKFDISIPSIVVEGKSDYYIIRFAQMMLGRDELRFIPATGSGTFEALIGLGAAWGTKFLFLLDSDNAGLKERERYALDHGARTKALTTIGDLVSGMKEIEDVLNDEARAQILTTLGLKKFTKKAALRFFQESLAKRDVVELGQDFRDKADKLLGELGQRMASL